MNAVVHAADWTKGDDRPICEVSEYRGHDGKCIVGDVAFTPEPEFSVRVRSVSMTSPWGEEAVWASVPVEVADAIFKLLGPPDLPFIAGGTDD